MMISVIIATYMREEALIATLRDVVCQQDVEYEVVVVDQTPKHKKSTQDILYEQIKKGNIKLLKNKLPNPAKARNLGASVAKGEILLFIDDDVVINDQYFLKKHLKNYSDETIWAVSGGEILKGGIQQDCKWADKLITPENQVLYFPRNSSKRAVICSCSTCNFSIRKEKFVQLNGLDENFKGNGYCDDADLGVRIIRKGGKIIFDPGSKVIHNFSDIGGCRIDNMQKYPGWQQYVSPFIFGFRYLKGKDLRGFLIHNALRKSIFLKHNVMNLILWPKVFCDTLVAAYKGFALSKKPVTSMFNSAKKENTDNVLLSHSGKQHSYKLAIALQKMGRLAKFITSAYYDPVRFPDKLFTKFKKIDKILRKRNEPGLSDKTKRYPVFEIPELILRSLFANNKITSNAIYLRDALFDNFVAKTKIRDCKIFWGFQGSCLESLKAAKKKNIITIAEFATGHVTTALRILGEEKIRNPEWADSISNLYFPSWYLERLKKEPSVADYCVAASGFCKRTLETEGVSPEKILTLPLGVDLEKFTFKKRETKGLFQILFVGGVGQRKGIKHLLDAYARIKEKNTRLKIIGPIIGSGKAFRKRSSLYEYQGVLSQDEIVLHMQQSHVLVLPSLFEGFGLVIPEAMATGMPVIASTNSAGPEIIREKIDGFILNPSDVDVLASKIKWLMENREKAVKMGENAHERAKHFSWGKYSERLEKILQVVDHGK